MPNDNVLVLGFHVERHRKQLDAFFGAHGIYYDDEDEQDIVGESLDDINGGLAEAHEALLKSKGFARLARQSGLINQYRAVAYSTPIGVRRFQPFELRCHLDSEAEDMFDDAVVGVAVCSRFYPTFVDWRSEFGSLVPIVFDAELQADLDAAKKAIAKVLPEFEKAFWIVKKAWY